MIAKILAVAKNQLAFVVGLAVLTSLVTGCAGQKLGKQTVVVKHYPECYRPINDLREAAKKVNQATAAGAIFGAITGAAIAYTSSGGNRADVVKGAVGGALTGAGLGYLISSEVQAMDQAERFRTYVQAMDMDIGNMKQAVAAAKITNGCYKKQYAALTKNYKAGRIPEAEMTERLKEIQDGTNDAITILNNYSEGATTAANTYDQVIAMERERPDRASTALISNLSKKKASQVQTARTIATEVATTTKFHDMLASSALTRENYRN
ncbi:MAG: hypothetical protein LBI10_10200 [Deltaproteobacteria bacterium]|jgi:hypothetical protein|nr:hypothetical protein [Deltaproteobacteria bacterium]